MKAEHIHQFDRKAISYDWGLRKKGNIYILVNLMWGHVSAKLSLDGGVLRVDDEDKDDFFINRAIKTFQERIEKGEI